MTYNVVFPACKQRRFNMSGRKRALIPSTVDDAGIKKKRSKSSNNSPCNTPVNNGKKRRAGTIVRITLKNFMCHSYLEVNLKNNINYIIGRNGSGKSAILTALVVGLGGKASVTNRGTTIKRFVKAGKTSGNVEIVLNNTGPDAYKKSIFGNEIIIQRNFTINGNSAYKIKSSTGKVIAKSSKEIQQILRSLNIQIDNPVCVLNQDTSRNFLSTSDAKQKFILFMRATGLEALNLGYKNVLANKKKISQEYEEKEKICQELKTQVMELQTKIANFEGIAELRKQLTFLNAELSWAKVRDIENEYSEHEAVVERLLAKCNKYEDYSKNKNQRLVEMKQKASELQQQIAELKEAAEVQNRPQLDLQNEIDGLRQSYTEKRQRKQHLLKQIQEKNKNVEALDVEINNFTENLNNVEQERLAKKKEMSDLEAQIGQIANIIETTQNDIFQLNNSINRQEEQETDLQRELKQTKNRHEQIMDQIESLKNETNSLVVYGKEMPEIVKAIRQKENRFTHLPRGPLGAFINIRDKKWDVAIEGFLGTGLLRAFTVDNKKDNTLLMEIFNKHCGSSQKPMVITSKFFDKVHDIRSNLVQADKDCISLYDAIDIKDPVVANCLIDQISIESILLIPSTEKAIELLSDQRRVPKNCSQGVTIKGDKFYPDPNYKTYASRYHRARYLQVDTKDLIRGHEEALVEFAAKLKNIQAQINAVVMDKSKQKHDLAELKKKLEKLLKTNFVAKRKLEDLRITEDSESVNVQALENEVSELKSVMQRFTAECGDIDEEMKSIKDQISNAEERLNELIQTGKEFEDRIAPLEQQIREQSKKRQELDVNSTFEKKRWQGFQNKLASARSEMLSKQKELDRLTEEAVTVGERIEKLRQVQDVVAEINTVQSTIRKVESSLENPEEVGEKYQKARQKYDEVTNFLQCLKESMQELDSGISKRKHHYEVTEDYFVNYINHNFSKVLDFRQFKGSLKVNTTEKKLELVVIPQQGSQGHTVTSNLSGGERSFSTVAFLYALWQCTNFPFYFLDEFDVFMDKINRTKVVEILIHHAKSRPELQYVFLTPQDVSFIRDNDVSIHKLEDPEQHAVPED